MGVTSLWEILGPTARPVRLEALSRKRMAVDASIWIYQFLKAVRDSEGNALPQSHIVGFFRRICKLLYYGILPIFVFDGGAPSLKRRTILKRRERREGHRESLAQTAQRLLAVQVQREAEMTKKPATEGDTVYLEDLPNLHPQHGSPSQANNDKEKNVFVRRDEYHLPELNKFKVSRKDARIMPEDEFQEQYDYSFDIVDGIDINTVDPASKEFAELPTPTQYMVLSHLRLRSRLRMGFSKDQLETLFPNSLDFSKFQIQQVQKRNFYTQRLMNVSGMSEDGGNVTKRISGDKDRKYALVRNSDGWTLALTDGGEQESNPIMLDENGEVPREVINSMKEELEDNKSTKKENEKQEEDSEVEWEDVSSNENEETEEERNMQKAVIESIYDQYRDEDPGTAHATGEDKLKQVVSAPPYRNEDFDEIELKQAIEESKRDLLNLEEQEKKFNQGVARKDLDLKKVENPQSSLLFNFDQSLLFGKKASDNTGSRKTQSFKKEEHASTNPNINFIDLTPDKVLGNGKSVPREDHGYDEKEKENTGTNVMSKGEKKEAPHEEKIKVNIVHEDSLRKQDLIQLEDNSSDIDDEEEPNSKPEKPRELPSWFNDSISPAQNPHIQRAETTRPSFQERKEDDDEAAGLISWREAQELMNENNEESEMNEEISPDEIEEIARSDVYPSQEDNEQSGPQHGVEEVEEKKPGRKAAVLDYDFEEEEENNLAEQLRVEEEEDEHFRSQIKSKNMNSNLGLGTSVTDAQLMQEKLQKDKRDSDEVTQNMITDVQELLKRFGIPYITAPMEAEAQCAELYRLKLVDGIITDDSDCFLFGGDRIYKNMFNQKQYVECYMVDDIEGKVGLTQEKLIELGLLLGSDYTEGIKGIGPVLAMEILAEFGTLKAFKNWFDENTQRIPDKKDQTSLKKNLLNRIKSGKLFLPDSFPDPTIRDAYTKPEVDHDASDFSWGIPNLDQIRSFLMFNLRWSQARVDEVLVPLVKDINKKRAEGTQSTIGEFFPQESISLRKSIGLGKRMKSAADKLNKRAKR